jgi:penicillin-binding protein 1A
MKRKIFKCLTWLLGLGLLAGVVVVALLWLVVIPRLPDIDGLRDTRLQVPFRVYTADEKLMAVYGEKRRTPLKLHEIPDNLIHAFIAAEDDRFYEHPGVDYQGILRAVANLVRTGSRSVGGSTITMQLTRNLYLSFDRTYSRKLNEILLAIKIEQELSKEEILELYLNKIYLGHRAYGVGAAAEIYYGKRVSELSLAEAAMIAALPKAPSRINPITSPERSLQRRNYVLRRMQEEGHISLSQRDQALVEVDTARRHELPIEVDAPYVAEMIRQLAIEALGDDIYTGGYRAYSTIDSRHQSAANQALIDELIAYDRRHGFRGPEAQANLPAAITVEDVQKALAGFQTINDMVPALVVSAASETAQLRLADGSRVTLNLDDVAWARPFQSADRRGGSPQTVDAVVRPGDIVRLHEVAVSPPEAEAEAEATNAERGDSQATTQTRWQLSQLPALQGALVSMDHQTGAITALAGGFSFLQSNFNRAVQAERQPGSAFKPFLWSSALANGMTAATRINDAPVVFDDPGLERKWRPGNYSGRFYGPTSLRQGLISSRNLVAIRLLQAIGIDNAKRFIERFGFKPGRMPDNLSLALGNMVATPLDITAGYAAFANGGHRVTPHALQRLVDDDDNVLLQTHAAKVCDSCNDQRAKLLPVQWAGQQFIGGPIATPAAPQAIDPRNAYIVNSMLRDVIERGTGRRARQLDRLDIGGKTGTTNDQRDAWFAGFGARFAVTTWVGFDDLEELGNGETGARAALPMWIQFMQTALDGEPRFELSQPTGLTFVRIDPDSGKLAEPGAGNAVMEMFFSENAPSPGEPDEDPDDPYELY